MPDLRGYTVCLYHGEWCRSLHRCYGWNIALCKATVPQIAEFLYLHRELKLSVSAKKSYRFPLYCVIAFAGMDLVTNRAISRMFSNFEKSCLFREITPSEWAERGMGTLYI